MSNIRILSANETKKLLSMNDVIDAVSQVYCEKAKGNTEVFPLVFHEFDPGHADMDIKSGWVKGANIFGLKLVSWFGANQEKGLPMLAGTVLVCDDQTGMPIGILDGAYVTGIRTGAAGAIGAKYLAKKQAKTFLMVGAGHISTFQIAATLMMIPTITTVRIYDPMDFENATKLASTIRETLKSEFAFEAGEEITFEAVDQIEEATKNSDIIITATPSKKPIILADWVKPGTHFSCIGADMEGKQEIDGTILAKARVFVDDLEQNCNVGEIEVPLKQGLLKKEDVLGEIGHVMNGGITGRTSDEDITVYDATGTALLDLVVGKLAIDIAKEKGIGVEVTL